MPIRQYRKRQEPELQQQNEVQQNDAAMDNGQAITLMGQADNDQNEGLLNEAAGQGVTLMGEANGNIFADPAQDQQNEAPETLMGMANGELEGQEQQNAGPITLMGMANGDLDNDNDVPAAPETLMGMANGNLENPAPEGQQQQNEAVTLMGGV